MPSAEETRHRLGATFNAAAATYHRARPDYPEQLYTELLEATGLTPPARLLEVGCGTGKATLPLAERGFAITCLEPGADLAAGARRNLAAYPDVQVVEASFESWQPPAGAEPFDLVFAATAWHWTDPKLRNRLAWQRLRPGGYLAIWGAGHLLPPDADPFFADIEHVYAEIGAGQQPGGGSRQQLVDSAAAIEAEGLFAVTQALDFSWVVEYDAAQYIALLNTFSDHIAMAPWQRDRLYGEIRARLAVRPGGRLRRHWGAVLQIAQRADG